MQRGKKLLSGASMVCAVITLFAGSASAAELPASGVLDLATDAELNLFGTPAAQAGAPGEQAGWVVAPAGDVNGDRKPDILVGAPRADHNDRADSGSLYVVFGPRTGKVDLGALGDGGFRVDGAAPRVTLGFSAAGAGDVNGDGKGDIVVGAPAVDAKYRGGTGTAYVVFGKADTAPIDLAAAGAPALRIDGAKDGDTTGVAVAGLGDVNGDKVPDVAVGSSGADRGGRASSGAAAVVFGRSTPGVVSLGALGDGGYAIDGAAGSFAGLSLAAAGDLNADGRPDVLVGAPARARDGRLPGAAYVVYGKASTDRVDLDTLGAAGLEIEGPESELFGVSVGMLGDLNGDGRADIGVGAPRADRNKRADSGSAYAIYTPAPDRRALDAEKLGAADGLRMDGANPGDAAGSAIDGIGDIDADGRPDLVVTAPFASILARDRAGAAYLVFSPKPGGPGDDAATIDLAGLGAHGVKVAGPREGDFLRSAAGAGDVDGDGAPDILVGTLNGSSGNGSGAGGGSAHLVLAPRPKPPAAPLPPDAGAAQEVAQDGCTAAVNVEILIDDSGSMSESDPEALRARAVQLLLAKPRNGGRIIGGVEFGNTTGQLFPPQRIAAPVLGSTQAAELREILERTLVADNGGTDYNAGFGVLRAENPDAAARIFLTDGEHNVGEYANGHRGGPPTYVVALGIGAKGSEAGDRLARIAKETKGRYFPRVTAEKLQAVINAIDSRLNCDIGLDAFVDNLTDEGSTLPNDVTLEDGAESADLNVSWDDAADVMSPGDLDVLDEDGDRVARLSAHVQRRALQAQGRTITAGTLKVRGSRGKTFYALRVNGIRGARLRTRVRAIKVRGRARIHTQVGQSRRLG